MTAHPEPSPQLSPDFQIPRQKYNAQGDERRVGFEIEYGGVELKDVAQRVKDLFGGKIVWQNRFSVRLQDTEFGAFDIHVDTSLLKDRRYREMLRKVGVELPGPRMEEPFEDLLFRLASTVVPHEIVTPPLPLEQLHKVEEVRHALVELGAGDTADSLLYAFGLHFNPETPDLNVSTLLSYLRAYLVLEPWLREQTGLDVTRRLTPFIDEFPDLYVALVVDPGYDPDMDGFVEDFLAYNPTRNRSLDMLPLLAEVRKDQVMAAAKEPHLVHPRPAYHYRLPDSRLNDGRWRVSHEWNRWVVVDDLAAAPERLAELSRNFLARKQRRLPDFLERWSETIKQWLS